VSLDVSYLWADLSDHFAMRTPAIILLCCHPVGEPYCYKMAASAPGITTTSKDTKQDIGLSLNSCFYLKSTILLPNLLADFLFQWSKLGPMFISKDRGLPSLTGGHYLLNKIINDWRRALCPWVLRGSALRDLGQTC
jgi:hypothetical protein